MFAVLFIPLPPQNNNMKNDYPMNNYPRKAILSLMAIISLTFLSCRDDDKDIEDPMPKLVENLPSAESVKSTSAYIPVYDEGLIELRWGGNEQLNPYAGQYLSTYLTTDSCGFLVTGLEPDCTYYYTMVYHKGDESICSKQIKSFTTKSVSIAFIEPGTISMGNWDRKVLRVKTSGVEERDVPYNLHVVFYCIRDGNDGRSVSAQTTYLGDGIWQDDGWPNEKEHWQAVIKCSGGRIVAETPFITLSNGILVEE